MSVKAKKHLGQHFLTDESIAKNIADALTENGYDNVLEIGPGMGVLTKYLLQKKIKTYCHRIRQRVYCLFTGYFSSRTFKIKYV
jgi:16S rRNA A1518/A1519 N6-dimethyltransferase RsmA/KsgA/DIM1 with predicted DNA glycosylase/AP lyase activity